MAVGITARYGGLEIRRPHRAALCKDCRRMLQETIEGKWVKAFVEVFRLCAVKKGEVVAILSESQSRPVLPRLSELALHQLEARPFEVLLSSPEISSPVPIRSTGTS